MTSSLVRTLSIALLAAGSVLADEPSFGTPAPAGQTPPPAPAKAPPPAPPPPAPLVQLPPAAPQPVAPQNTVEALNKALQIYVFPAKGQAPEVQQKEMGDCYTWAIQQSGVDPLTTTQTQVAETPKGPDGSAVRGAAKGALLGAAVGGITGNAGQGAAVGATMGGAGGLSKRKQRQKQQQAQAEAAAKNADVAKIESFKKAYTVCLEGKGYTAK